MQVFNLATVQWPQTLDLPSLGLFRPLHFPVITDTLLLLLACNIQDLYLKGLQI